jgi:Flp pilus assembly protein TadD
LFFRLLIAFGLASLLGGFGQEAESHFKAGLALKAKGDMAGAKAELRRALELNPKLTAAHFYLAGLMLQDGQAQEAIDQLEDVPRSPAVDRLLGLANLETGNPKRASFFFAHPKDAEGHYYLGITLGQQGQVPEALREFRSAITLRPSFGPAHESLGVALRRQGEGTQALREFRLAARDMPKNAVTLCDLGLALKEAGQLSGAEQALRSALELKPDFERARFALGIVLRMNGNAAGATAQMDQVRESHAKRTTDAQVRKLINDGVTALRIGRASDAKSTFENARALDPSDASSATRPKPLISSKRLSV